MTFLLLLAASAAVGFAVFCPHPALTLGMLAAIRYLALLFLARRLSHLRRVSELLESDPTNVGLHFKLAEVYLDRGLMRPAVKAFRAGIELDPELKLEEPMEAARCLSKKDPTTKRLSRHLFGPAVLDYWIGQAERLQPTRGAFLAEAGELSSRRLRKQLFRSCKEMMESLRVELLGLEQVYSQLHQFVSGEKLQVYGTRLRRQMRELRERIRGFEAQLKEIEG